MEEIATVYARSLFEAAQDADKLEAVRDQLGEIADAIERRPRPAGLLLLAVPVERRRRRRACTRPSPTSTTSSRNFLELLIENHRMPVLFKIRRELDALWDEENQLLPVHDHLGGRARREDRQADRRPDRRADRPQGRAVRTRSTPTCSAASSCGSATPCWTPPSASASTTFAREVAASGLRRPPYADQARRDHLDPQEPHRGPGDRQGRPGRGRHRPVRGRRHRPRPRPRERAVVRDARVPARRDGPRAQPRVRQRRRRAVRRLDEDRRGRHGQAHQPPARGPGRRRAARPHRRPARPAARRQGRDQDRQDAPRRAQGPGRRPAPAGGRSRCRPASRPSTR